MMKSGATDYVLKQRLSRLVPAVNRALKEVAEQSDRTLAATKLRSSELQYRNLLSSARDIIFSLSSNGTINTVSQAFEWTTGWKAEDWIGKNVLELIHSEDTAKTQEVFSRVARGEKTALEEIRIFSSKSDYLIAEFSIALQTIEGSTVEILAIGRDITQRKRIEAQMREQAALIDVVPNAIVVRNLEDRITLWNSGAECLYGWTAEEALGKLPEEIIYKGLTPEYAEAKKALLQAGRWQGELHQFTRSGMPITVESRWMPVRSDEGEADSIVVVNTDITEKKKLEQHFLRAQRMESIGTLAGA